MDTQMSSESTFTSSKVPLTGQEQWEHFTAHHCGRWQGVLLRYDGAGKVLDVLDSVRSFIPSEDWLTVTHSLDFSSRITGTVTSKQWMLTSGNPLITHPVDPSAYLLFNRKPPDVMVGSKRTGETFYFEPYLIAGEKRTSVVVMYKEENSPQPRILSFFREVKEGSEKPWWSEETMCTIAHTSLLTVPAHSSKETYVSLDEMAQMPVPSQLFDVQGDFLHIQFPDAVDLVVSLNRFETPYYASMWWVPAQDEATRICSLIYRESNQKPEVLSV